MTRTPAESPITAADLRAIRLAMGWTLQRMGEAIGYRGNSVAANYSKLESGRERITYPVGHLALAIFAGYEPGSVKPPVG